MSVTVSGGLLHVPEWSIRVDQIKEMYDSDQDGLATVMWSMDSDCDTFRTTATRAEIIAALELWDRHQRVLAVHGSRNMLEGKYNV